MRIPIPPPSLAARLATSILALCGALALAASARHDTFTRLAFATPGGSGQPSVAIDEREGFVVTWQQRDAGTASLHYAVIDREGRERRRGVIAQGQDWFVNWADFPSLVVLRNGDWVTHYLQRSADSPYAYGIRIVRSRDRGRTWSAPITPHTDGTATEHGFVSLAPAGRDRVVVVWLDGRRAAEVAKTDAKSAGHSHGHDEGEEAAPMTLRTAVIDRAGKLSEARELDDSTCSCCQTDHAAAAGLTYFVYRDRSADEIRDIALVTRDARGTWSTPRVLHADHWRIEGCPVNGPAIAANAERIVAVWPTLVGENFELRYAFDPWPVDAPAHVLASGAGTLGRVDVAAWRDGFLVSSLGGRGEEAGLYVTEIRADGELGAREHVARAPVSRLGGNPRLATSQGRALLAWVEKLPDGDATTVALALKK